jgi:hypothetical protein
MAFSGYSYAVTECSHHLAAGIFRGDGSNGDTTTAAASWPLLNTVVTTSWTTSSRSLHVKAYMDSGQVE